MRSLVEEVRRASHPLRGDSRAVEPLERTARWLDLDLDVPETYPFAL